jgi:hypothetical protein
MDTRGTHNAVQPAGLQCVGATVTSLLAFFGTLWARRYANERLADPSRNGQGFAERVVWMHGRVHTIQTYLVEVRTPLYIPTPTTPLVVVPSPVVDAYEPAPSKVRAAPVPSPEADDAPGLSGLLRAWAESNGEWIAWSLVLGLLLGSYGVLFCTYVLSATPRAAGASGLMYALCPFQGRALPFSAFAVLDKADADGCCMDLVPWVVVSWQALVEAALASVVGTDAPGDSEPSLLAAAGDRLIPLVALPFGSWYLRKVVPHVVPVDDAETELAAPLDKAGATSACMDLVPWVVVGLRELVEAASPSVADSEVAGDSAEPSFSPAVEVRLTPRVALPHGKWHIRKEIARVYVEDDAEREVGAGENVEWTIPQHSTKHLVWMLSDGDERERLRKRGSADNREFAKRAEKRLENRQRAFEVNSLVESDEEWVASMVVDPLLVRAGSPRVALPRREKAE